ncbi:MAG: hypothetical protein IJV70_01760 [Clostridia bacterium]|nr:hypothetical protein [Clostridia bacterium]
MKILYYDYKISAARSCVRLSAVRRIILDKDESVPAGTPKCFDEALLKAAPLSKLKKYYLCHETHLASSCNSVTEYKKIWGLQGLTKGLCDAAYTVSGKRIYLGIKEENGEGAVSNIEIYAPENTFDPAAFCSLLKETWCDLSQNEYIEAFAEIAESSPDIFILKYFSGCDCGVDVYTGKATELFEALKDHTFPKESETFFRKRAFWG